MKYPITFLPAGTNKRVLVDFDGVLRAKDANGVPIHGASSAGSNNDVWVEATSPEVVVYGTGTRHRHPRCPAVERYQPRLASVPTHPAQCDSRGQTWDSDLAEYVTDIVGNVVIETNGRSPLQLTCEATQGCSVNVAH